MNWTFKVRAFTAATFFGLPSLGLAAECIAAAAQYHGINLHLMQAIVMQESGGQPDAINCANGNGSCDFGLTQINSMHLPRLKTYGVTRSDLFNPCVAAFVGAWILAENFDRMGVTWEAVGAYNARSHDKRMAYARKIHRKVLAIQRGALVPVTIPMRANDLAQAALAARDVAAQVSLTDPTASGANAKTTPAAKVKRAKALAVNSSHKKQGAQE